MDCKEKHYVIHFEYISMLQTHNAAMEGNFFIKLNAVKHEFRLNIISYRAI